MGTLCRQLLLSGIIDCSADSSVLASSKMNGEGEERLVGENLRQLPTAWLDCWSWTEENIPRVEDQTWLPESHMLAARQTWEQLYSVHSCTAAIPLVFARA